MDNIITNLLPEIVVLLTSISLLINSIVDQNDKRITNKIILTLGLIIATFTCYQQSTYELFLNGVLENTEFTKSIKFILILTSLLALIFVSNSKSEELKNYFNEYCFLLTLSLVGSMLLISSREFFMLIIAFETLSIPIYLITAMGPNPRLSVEASTKLFFFGTFSTVILVFSAVLFFASTGSTFFSVEFWQIKDLIPLLSIFFMLIAVSFKAGLFPFHFWVSDTYQAAPLNLIPYLSVIPKISIICFFIIFMQDYSSNGNNKIITDNIVIAFSCISIIFGSILTMKQEKLLRLLAYSGIPHAGMLLLFSVLDFSIAKDFIIIYITFYSVANICLYISLNSLKISSEEITLNSLKGIFKDNPFVAISLAISLLSLAGAPLTAGFWGKFNVVILSYSSYGMLIPIVILLGALMSFYYYIKIIRNLFSSKQINTFQGIEISNINYLILTICIFMTILLGINPGLIIKIL